MPHDPSLATAVRSETAVPGAASSPTETLPARIERAGPAALDDHELLGLVGIDVDIATLAAAGGLRELLDDPDDRLRTFSLTDIYLAVVSRWAQQEHWRPVSLPKVERLTAAVAARPAIAPVWARHFGTM